MSESYKTVRWPQSKGHDWVPNYSDPTAGDMMVMNGGGFASNPEMRTRYLGPRWDTVKIRGIPYNTGEGRQMALAVGALPYGSWTSCHASPQDMNRPAYSLPSTQAIGSIEWNRYAFPFGILVNVHWQRFVDEVEDILALTCTKMGRAILVQPQGIAFQIFDARAREQGLLAAYGHVSGDTADTLEALAGKLGVDSAGLVHTAQTFNAAIQPGPTDLSPFRTDGNRTDSITPPKSNYAMIIERPPFEGYAVCCGITFTFGGLKADPGTGQVQHVAGRPILGLYIAREMLGGLWHWNYLSGSGMMASEPPSAASPGLTRCQSIPGAVEATTTDTHRLFRGRAKSISLARRAMQHQNHDKPTHTR